MITINGKTIPCIEAHAHTWKEFGGQRFGDCPTEVIGYGKVKQGGKSFYLLTPENADLSNRIEILEGYMDWHGVDKAVLIQNPCYGDQKDYVKEVVERSNGKFVGIGMIEPRELESLPAQIDDLIQNYGFKGVKMEVPDTPFVMDAPEYDILWQTIEANDCLCVIDLGWGDGEYDFNIERFTNVVKKHPAMKTVLCHVGVSRLWDRNQKAPFPELQKTLDLFTINTDNLWMDVSAMYHFDTEYPYPRAMEIFRVVYDAVGSGKLMWGSDFPTTQTECTYKQCLTMFTNHIDYLTDEDWENIMYKTALRVYFDGKP